MSMIDRVMCKLGYVSFEEINRLMTELLEARERIKELERQVEKTTESVSSSFWIVR